MKRHFPIPLKLITTGLSRKRAFELADRLVDHFDTVENWGDDEIVATAPFDMRHYGQAWEIIDRYGVKWV